MTAPSPTDPCFAQPQRGPLPDGRRIRVLELLATGTNGGAQEHVYSLLLRLDPTRYDVQVVSLSDGSTARRIQAAGFPTLVLDHQDDTAAREALTTHLLRAPVDVIHNHMYRAEVVGTRSALALAEAGEVRPYVISTVHSSRVRSAEDRAIVRSLTPSMDRLVAVSRAITTKLEHEGRMTARVELIYNGVDLRRYDHQEPCCTLPDEYGFPQGTPVVGVVARLEPEKGHPTLLDAWPSVLDRVPDARLLVVGEGSRRPDLEAQARELGLLGREYARPVGTIGAPSEARVVFTGRREDVPAVVAAMDVAVLPSYREAQGLSILEAMALRRPVIASNVGGIPEMIEDGRTGLLVPPRDPVALADAIVRLLTDHPLADQLARSGHDLVHDRFCIERMVQALEALYDEGAAEVAARRGRADRQAPAA